MEITCINCPVGCRVEVTVKNGQVTDISGYSCRRGVDYAKQESVNPMRMVTAVVSVKGSRMPLSVKTRTPIPKSVIFECMKRINELSLSAPIRIGQVVCENVCDTGVDIIATKSVE